MPLVANTTRLRFQLAIYSGVTNEYRDTTSNLEREAIVIVCHLQDVSTRTAGGMFKDLYLCVGLKVVVTDNLWTPNGAGEWHDVHCRWHLL